MSKPICSVALEKTNGEWIVTKFDDGTIYVKLYGDDKGRRICYDLTKMELASRYRANAR